MEPVVSNWHEPAPGDVVAGRYMLERLVGFGGMGSVWAAQHTVTGKRVALKVLDVERDEVRRRFIREARVAASLQHRHIIDVHDVIEIEGGRPAMVMDLLDGEPLGRYLERVGRISVAAMAELMLPVISAVKVAHEAGVVHRDIKPDNIFLAIDPTDDQPIVKVLDFGIAKVTAAAAGLIAESVNLTRTGSLLGTPTHMAPEQVYGESDVGPRADVWSLGIVFYQCLAGACPITGDNIGQVFKAISQRLFVPAVQALPELPSDVTYLIDRMMATNPAARPDLDEIFEALIVHCDEGLFTGAWSLRPPSSRSGWERKTPSCSPTVREPRMALDTEVVPPVPSPHPARRWLVGGLAAAMAVGALAFVPGSLASAEVVAATRAPQPNRETRSQIGTTANDEAESMRPELDAMGAQASSSAAPPTARPIPSSASHWRGRSAARPATATAAPPSVNPRPAPTVQGVYVESPY